MVQSVRLLVGDEDAEMTKEIIFNLLDSKENKISDKSKSFGGIIAFSNPASFFE